MNPTADDPGRLSRLHDIVVEPPVSWWPPTPAWSVLGLLILTGLCLIISWMILAWRRSAYRRVGLAELRRIEQSQSNNPQSLANLAELLKRVALVAYPRHQVASLTGIDWLRFLDHTIGTVDFSAGPGQQLQQIYGRVRSTPTPELIQLARYWIRRHRRDAGC